MIATAICTETKQLIANNTLVHGKVFNVLTNDRHLISFLSDKILPAPRSICVDLPARQSMHVSGFLPGMSVAFSSTQVCIGSYLHIDLTRAREWDPHPTFNFDPIGEHLLVENIRSVRDILMCHGNLHGIAGITPFLLKTSPVAEERNPALNSAGELILPRINKLLACIISGDMESLRHAAGNVVGFGPGLTPSADDFLCALMASLLYSDAYYARNLSRTYQINNAIIGKIFERTTTLSAEMLSLAAQGWVAEGVRRLLLAVFAENGQRALKDRLLSVLDYGETSGTDLTAGVYAGCLLGMCLEDHGRTVNLASLLS